MMFTASQTAYICMSAAVHQLKIAISKRCSVFSTVNHNPSIEFKKCQCTMRKICCSQLDTIYILYLHSAAETTLQKIVLQLSVFSVIFIWQPKPELETLQAFIDRPV